MKNKIIIMISLAASLALETGLNAVIIKPAEGPVQLNEKLMKGAKKIARAILNEDPWDVHRIYFNVIREDLLTYQDPEESLELVRQLTEAVTSQLIKHDEKLRSLDNEAGKHFISIQDDNINLLSAARARQPESGEFDLIKYWTLNPIVQRAQRYRCTNRVLAAEFSPDGNLLATGCGKAGQDRGSVELWNVETGNDLLDIPTKKRISSVTFSPNGEMLAYGVGGWASDPGYVGLLNIFTGEQHDLQVEGDRAVRQLAFSPDGKFLASASSNSVRVWDVENRTTVLQREVKNPLAVAFSFDSAKLAYFAGTDQEGFVVRLINREAGFIEQEVRITIPAGVKVDCAVFSPNAKLVALGTDAGITWVWNVDKNRKLAQLTAPGDHSEYSYLNARPTALAFSPDGKLLIAGTELGDFRLWNVETATEIWELKRGEVITAATFSLDGKTIALGNIKAEITYIHAEEKKRPQEPQAAYTGVD